MNPGAETIEVSLSRVDTNEPWGFRLNGGIDFTTPLSVSQVNPGGVGDRCGLKAGDAVLRINNKPSDELEHEAAKYEILRSGNTVNMLLQRAAVSIWKPKVTPMSDLKTGEVSQVPYGEDGQQYVQKTSLAYTQPEPLNIGSAHNRSARPFPGFGGGAPAPAPAAPAPAPAGYGGGPPGGYGGGPPGGYGAPPQDSQGGLVNAQYNTPIQMYSGQNVADSYNAHAQALSSDLSSHAGAPQQYGGGGGAPPPGFGGAGGGGYAQPQPAAGGVTGIRSVRAPITKPPGERKPEAQHATCQVCGSLCVGVFVKVKGQPMHPECYKCQSCGINLKQKGFIQVGGKFYCENCAR